MNLGYDAPEVFPPAIPVQSPRDWLQARCPRHKELHPRFRGDDILTWIHLPGCADSEDEFSPSTLSRTLSLSRGGEEIV
ncbi:MAG TPA: hypothetical protein PK360_01850, partial [bacterium]|nr:hypothetical protein [bacterium]